ncbi:MAG: transposase [Patescibacteria group bacterium]
MAIRKEKFHPGEYYHIYSRTVLKVPEFKDYGNAKKLAQTFLVANSTNSTKTFDYIRKNINPPFQKIMDMVSKGDKLVNILCYSIMPDHYHLLLEELREEGITDFIRKCNTSIAKYINIKTDRSGALFESKFKSKHIDSNNYLLHLSVYIHLNPLDFLSGREWRFNKMKNWENEKNKLLNHPWSSIRFFLDKNYNDEIISGTEIITEQFKDKKDYEFYLKDWSMDSLEIISDLVLD